MNIFIAFFRDFRVSFATFAFGCLVPVYAGVA